MPVLAEHVLSNNVPSNWDPMSASHEMELIELSKNSPEYNGIMSKLNAKDVVRHIFRIQNPYLWGCYQLKKEECVQRNPSTRELELWHVTSESNANSIASQNFDWRRARAARSKFGRGVTFSPIPDFANTYSSRKGVQILSKVLVGNELSVGGGKGVKNKMSIPPEEIDTTSGNDRKVLVKFSDHEFYPTYIVIEADKSDVASVQQLLRQWISV